MTAGQWVLAAVGVLALLALIVGFSWLLALMADRLARDTAAIEAENEVLRQANAAKRAELDQRAAQTHPARAEAAQPAETTQETT